jgi:beta-phosphoglucomutase
VPGSKETLAELKERNFFIGVMSNSIYPLEWKMQRLEKACVAEFIDIVACSTDLRLHKPDSEFYMTAIQQADFTPPETAFVGHDQAEIMGASHTGMLTVAVNQETGLIADYSCSSIVDILTIPDFSICHSTSG